jgi:hypothetical protein
MNDAEKTVRVRALNDELRTAARGGMVTITRGVQALGEEDVAGAVAAMRRFDTFTEDNDPHGEHDFGRFESGGHAFFFKMDYYDSNLELGSEEPWNPEKTRRVLTLMLCDEY